MIRILQQNNKATKIVFAVIIGFAVVTMIITLVPGIFDNVGASSDLGTFATVHEPGLAGKLFGETVPVTQADISRVVAQQMQGRQVPPYLMPYFQNQAGQQLVQMAILKIEGDRRGLAVTDEDLSRVLHQGQFGQVLFPGGNYVGDDKYMDFIQNQFNMTRGDFEALLKKEIEQGRLLSLITGGVSVSDADVRDAVRLSGTKVKFDYALISSDELSKTLNPSDSDLQAFFKTNAPRYATAVPETRKLQYLSFGVDQVPGGRPQVSDSDVLAYYNAHQAAYKVADSVKARHILIAVPQGADAKADAAAKAKAEDILKQIKAGGNFAALAAANSDDPGSKSSGGELGTFTRGKMVPEFEKAAFSLQPGQTSDLVKTSFGYHLIQVEQKESAHMKPLAEVKAEIVPLLEQQKIGSTEQAFANTLAAEAKKDGIGKTAAAHNLHAIITDYLPQTGTVAGVADGTAMLTQAFGTTKGVAPLVASIGDGFAVFQVVDIKTPHAPSFDDYKSHILTDYRDQQVPQMLNARLGKLAERARALNDLRKAAAELGIPVKSSDLVGKDGQVPDLGSMAGPGSVAFSLPKGGVSGPINLGKFGAVLAVTDVQEPNADELAKNLSQTREQMVEARRQEVFNVYLGTLADKYKKAGAIRFRAKPAGPGQLPLGT